MKKSPIIGFFIQLTLLFSTVIAGKKEDLKSPTSYMLSKEQKNENLIIPGASYVLYEHENNLQKYPMPSSKYEIFYTYNGDPIKTVEEKDFVKGIDYSYISKNGRLDPHAQKPQPTHYKIKYRRAFIKGSSGWQICFYDKNNNEIECHWYNKKFQAIQMTREGKYKRQHPGISVLYEQIYDLYPFPAKTESFEDFPLDLSIATQSLFDQTKNVLSDYVKDPILKFLSRLIWGKPEKSSVKKTYIIH